MSDEDIRIALRHHKLAQVAKAVGVDPSTLYSFMRDPFHQPRRKTLEKLEAYLVENAVVGGK